MSSQVFGQKLYAAYHIRTFSKNTGINGTILSIPQKSTTVLPVLHALAEYPTGVELPGELNSFFNGLTIGDKEAVTQARKIWERLEDGAVGVKLFTHGSGWLLFSATIGTEPNVRYLLYVVAKGKGEVRFVVGRKGEGVVHLRENGDHDVGDKGEEVTDVKLQKEIEGWTERAIVGMAQMAGNGITTLGELATNLDYRDNLFLRVSGVYAAFELAEGAFRDKIVGSMEQIQVDGQVAFRRGLLLLLSRAFEMSFGAVCSLMLTASEKRFLTQVAGSYKSKGKCLKLARAGEQNLIGVLYPKDARNGSLILELRRSVARGTLEQITFGYGDLAI